KARPVIGLIALGDGFGEGIRVAEQTDLALCRVEMLLRLALAAEGADLDDPAGVRRRMGMGRGLGLRMQAAGGCGRSWLGLHGYGRDSGGRGRGQGRGLRGSRDDR